MPVSMAKPLVGDGLWERVGVGRWGRSLAGGDEVGAAWLERGSAGAGVAASLMRRWWAAKRPAPRPLRSAGRAPSATSKRHLICDGQGIPLAVILPAGTAAIINRRRPPRHSSSPLPIDQGP